MGCPMCSPAKGGSTTLGSVLLSPGFTQDRGQPLNLERVVMIFVAVVVVVVSMQPLKIYRLTVSPLHLHVSSARAGFGRQPRGPMKRTQVRESWCASHAVHFTLLICGNNRGSKMLRTRPGCNIKAQRANLVLKKGRSGIGRNAR